VERWDGSEGSCDLITDNKMVEKYGKIPEVI
jgi:hypothetical protein